MRFTLQCFAHPCTKQLLWGHRHNQQAKTRNSHNNNNNNNNVLIIYLGRSGRAGPHCFAAPHWHLVGFDQAETQIFLQSKNVHLFYLIICN